MTEGKVAREFSADLVKALFETEDFNHLDGYGGALLVLDIEDAVEALQEKGWKLTKEESGG